MRWQQKKDPDPGQEDFVRKFLWWPLTIAYETRWLEVATYKVKWRRVSDRWGLNVSYVADSIEWVNK